jgi:hypothetical protein
VPFCPELFQRIVAVPKMVTKKCQKWKKGNLYWYAEKAAIPGKKGECKEGCGE